MTIKKLCTVFFISLHLCDRRLNCDLLKLAFMMHMKLGKLVVLC